ncbi:MAG: hypothetical protein ACFFB0_13165 [Promethearchaeota archaeon]
MKVKEENESNQKKTSLILFRFELNRTQTTLFLILSLIGIFLFPSILAGIIFYDLFQSIFVELPSYDKLYRYYHFIYKDYEHFLFGTFAPVITNIIIHTILLFLSIYILKKILNSRKFKDEYKKKIIPQNRISNWLGFKLSHSQAVFMFIFSFVGILFTIHSFFNNYIPANESDLFEIICYIPTSSEGALVSIESHEILLKNVPLGINATFLIFCLYSLIATRRGEAITPSKKVVKTYALLIFILSMVISIFLLARLFCHVALFNYEISYVLGIPPHTPTSEQNIDFIITFVLLIICFILIIASYFIKKNSPETTGINNEVSWFHIKLTPNRSISLLSSSIFTLIVISYGFLPVFIIFTGNFISFYWNSDFFAISFLGIYIIILILCYYSIEKVLKKRGLDNVINEIDTLEEFETNWFKFRLNRLYSIVFLSVSCGFIVFYVFQLITFNMNFRYFVSEDEIYTDSFTLFSYPIMISILVVLIAINIHTIKRTLPSLKYN